MILKVLTERDGSWLELKAQWEAQYAQFGEEFDADATFGVLNPLAVTGHQKSDVYGLFSGPECKVVCEVNRTLLPGYDGYVLRVRNVTFAPLFDFGDETIEVYGAILVELFMGVLKLSVEVSARHVKFHLRSPVERSFFQMLSTPLSAIPNFEKVAVRGSWLYLTKKETATA